MYMCTVKLFQGIYHTHPIYGLHFQAIPPRLLLSFSNRASPGQKNQEKRKPTQPYRTSISCNKHSIHAVIHPHSSFTAKSSYTQTTLCRKVISIHATRTDNAPSMPVKNKRRLIRHKHLGFESQRKERTPYLCTQTHFARF